MELNGKRLGEQKNKKQGLDSHDDVDDDGARLAMTSH